MGTHQNPVSDGVHRIAYYPEVVLAGDNMHHIVSSPLIEASATVDFACELAPAVAISHIVVEVIGVVRGGGRGGDGAGVVRFVSDLDVSYSY
jgi:hypothetical protein